MGNKHRPVNISMDPDTFNQCKLLQQFYDQTLSSLIRSWIHMAFEEMVAQATTNGVSVPLPVDVPEPEAIHEPEVSKEPEVKPNKTIWNIPQWLTGG